LAHAIRKEVGVSERCFEPFGVDDWFRLSLREHREFNTGEVETIRLFETVAIVAR
jgi:hypothetical protein